MENRKNLEQYINKVVGEVEKKEEDNFDYNFDIDLGNGNHKKWAPSLDYYDGNEAD